MVEHGLRSPFLMDAVKALAALHLLTVGQPVPSNRIAAYQGRALKGYRKAIEQGNPNDYAALLGCALLMIAVSSHNFRDPRAKRLFIVDWIPIWRGIGVIAETVPPGVIHASGLADAMNRTPVNLEKTARYVPNNLLFMVASINDDEADHKYRDEYYELLKYLGSLYMELVEFGFNPILDLRIITFLSFWPRALLPAARELRPRVLVVLAYWLCFVKLLDRRTWWMSGIIAQADQIFSELGAEWDNLLRVPKAVMRTEGNVEIAGMLIHNRNWTPGELDLYEDRTRSDPRMKTELRFVVSDGYQVGVTDGHWRFRDGEIGSEVSQVYGQDATGSDPSREVLIPCFPPPGPAL
ncbi:hypothetical protein F4861DRAFT_502555 [Xylaria intraflava]|nr:hypothetical protein F4861DRAFT_502555 [Xylaria intraflava]